MWIILLQCDLTHGYCNIHYEYVNKLWLFFEGGYYFHQLKIPAATIQGQLLYTSTNSRSLQRPFEGSYYILPPTQDPCSDYSEGDYYYISTNSRYLQQLFEGSYYILPPTQDPCSDHSRTTTIILKCMLIQGSILHIVHPYFAGPVSINWCVFGSKMTFIF